MGYNTWGYGGPHEPEDYHKPERTTTMPQAVTTAPAAARQCPSLYQLTADAEENLRQVRVIIELVHEFATSLVAGAGGSSQLGSNPTTVPPPAGMLFELGTKLYDTKRSLDSLETNLRSMFGALTRPAEGK